MPSVHDLYEFFLEPADLKEKAHLVQIQSAKPDNTFNPRSNKPEKKLVLRFVNRRKAMILNKTQAAAMLNITGTDDYTKWIGIEVVLVADRATNGRDTIRICTREDSGDLDLHMPSSWETKFNDVAKRIGLTDGAAKTVLASCENDYRTAFEQLEAEYKVKVKQ
jgi:hypothetical protein